ncbi:MAG: hypothetical protein GY791_04540 [Alphaproteobacteria bacterium]|nr:hypothetical protein [Alphaproteobacteria bacterium]
MSPYLLLTIAAVAAAGITLSLQSPINAVLARHAGDPVVASMISFAVGTLVLLAIVATRLLAVPSRKSLASGPADLVEFRRN